MSSAETMRMARERCLSSRTGDRRASPHDRAIARPSCRRAWYSGCRSRGARPRHVHRCMRAARRCLPCRSQAAMPPMITPRITSTKISANSGTLIEAAGWSRRKRIERYRHDLAVRDREHHDDDRERHEHKPEDKLSNHGRPSQMKYSKSFRGETKLANPESRCRRILNWIADSRVSGARRNDGGRRPPQSSLFSRSRISLPVLKNGTDFFRPRHARRCADCGRFGPAGSSPKRRRSRAIRPGLRAQARR